MQDMQDMHSKNQGFGLVSLDFKQQFAIFLIWIKILWKSTIQARTWF